MGKSSIDEPFSMAMLNNQMVVFDPKNSTNFAGDP